MSYTHLLAVVLALVGVVPAITLLSPFQVAHRAVPAIMICASITLWFLPSGIDFALAAVPVAAYISAKLGIEHAGHEPADYTPAVAKAKTVTQAAREKIWPSKPVEIQQLLKKAYPLPGNADSGNLVPDEAELERDDAVVEDDDLDDEPEAQDQDDVSAETLSAKIQSLIDDPRMPDGAQTRLAGQRAGRDSSIGLRAQDAPVRSFVPSLLG